VPVGSRIFSTSFTPALGFPQPPIQWVPGVKRLGCEADHSPTTSAKIKQMWIYISTPHNFAFFYFLSLNKIQQSLSKICRFAQFRGRLRTAKCREPHILHKFFFGGGGVMGNSNFAEVVTVIYAGTYECMRLYAV
jgi:hypothetical protein